MQPAGFLLKALAVAALVSSAVVQGQTTQAPTPAPTTNAPVTSAPVTTAPVTIPPPLPTVPPKNCSAIPNKDRVGFDLDKISGTLDSCPVQCNTTPACVTYTWNNYNGGTCWLKSRAGALIDKAGVFATNCEYHKPMVCNAFKDIDFVGMDIGSRPGKAAGDCCDVCNEFTGCTAYAWSDFNGGTCYLKKSVGQTEYKPGVISSSLLPLYGGVCAAEYNVDFVGNDIGNKPSKDAGICCGQCKATPGCMAYTWSSFNGGTCWMKSAKGKAEASSGVTSATIAFA